MAMIHAAAVESFDEAPYYREVPGPQAAGGQEVVEVLAVGLSHATKAAAAGKHYTSPTTLPFVAGIDAVIRRPDQSLGFVMMPPGGTLAERIAVDPATIIPVPNHADPAIFAATLNAAMSPWIALHSRVQFQPGQSILIIGATGNAGSMAVKVAKHIDAGRIMAAGRDEARLNEALANGADEIIEISGHDDAIKAAYGAAAAEVDVVLDYVWGRPTELAMQGILEARTQHERILDWVQIGGMGGTDITLGGHALRHNALRISGSGYGSVPMGRAKLPELAVAIADAGFSVTPRPVALKDVHEAWTHSDARGERTVILL